MIPPPCFLQDLRLFSPSLQMGSYYGFCWLLLIHQTITSPIVNWITLKRPPRVSTTAFLSCNCQIYCMGFGQYWTSLCSASSSFPSQPFIWFLFVSSRVCVRLPSDSTSPWTPLSFANSSYCQACSGLPPPSYCPFWANQKNGLEQGVPDRFFILMKMRMDWF